MNRRSLFLAGLGVAFATSALADMSLHAMRGIVENALVVASQGLAKCPKCGAKTDKKWRFCDKCGAKLAPSKPPTTTWGSGGSGGKTGTSGAGGTSGTSGSGGTSANVHIGHSGVPNRGLKVFTVTNLPIGLTSGAQIARGLGINSKGSMIAYGSNSGATTDVYMVDTSKPLNSPKLISSDSSGAEFDPDFHPDGMQMAFMSEGAKSGSRLQVEHLNGTGGATFTLDGAKNWQPRFSPNGKKVVYVRKESDQGPGDLWILDLASSVQTQLTSGPSNDDSPTWCPLGCHIAFESDRSGSQQIWSVTTSAPALEQTTFAMGQDDEPNFFETYLSQESSTTAFRVPTPRQLTKVGPHRRPAWSKRGYIIYESNFTIYAMNENGSDEQMVSTLPLAGTMARVSADGSAIVFQRRQSLGNEAFIIRLK